MTNIIRHALQGLILMIGVSMVLHGVAFSVFRDSCGHPFITGGLIMAFLGVCVITFDVQWILNAVHG